MAHELGHLLWDPDQYLKRLVVDKYETVLKYSGAVTAKLDEVERRANAFAIEFLAPANAVLESFKSAGGGAKGLEHVVTIFGVSKTALANHLMNVSHNQIVVDPKEVGYLDTDEWEASESLAVPVFNPQSVPISRRGQFANYVRKALQRGLISRDTAASLYQCALSDLDRAVESTKNFVAPLEEQLA